jgi:hypothetical protein
VAAFFLSEKVAADITAFSLFKMSVIKWKPKFKTNKERVEMKKTLLLAGAACLRALMPRHLS